MPTIRIVKVVMVSTVGLWSCLIAYGNLADYGSNRAFVQHVLAMDTVFPDNAMKHRAIADPTLQTLAYAAIIATQGAMAALLLYGAGRLWRARRDRRAFVAAKAPAALGLLVVWVLYYFGFVTIGGEWFSMWQSAVWNGQQKAVMFATCAALALIVLLLPEEAD